MTDQTDPATPPGDAAVPPGSRIAFERLRERTDELELIVSGLLAFALLTLPGRLFDGWAANAVHLEGVFLQALWFGFLASVGFSYTLGIAFIIHLTVRGYWIGLIGLKSTFPAGIRWDKVPMMGPIARAYHRERIGDLGSAIDRSDRMASMLFATAILAGLTMAWLGVLYVVMILFAGAVGALFGDTERIAAMVLAVIFVLFMLASVLPWLIDKLASRRQQQGTATPGFERAARAMLRVSGWLFPQRLILPVQLTLQTNLPSNRFMATYYVVLSASMALGGLHVVGSQSFSTLHRYDVLNTEAIRHGMRSAHYETLRSERDVLLRYPMIPSDRIAEAHLRLFLPHQPQHDNPLAREGGCTALAEGRNNAKGEAAATLARDCIASLWAVTLDGAAVPLDDFVPVERRDLGMRGLVGYLPIGGFAPGRHDLRLTWNPQGDDDGPLRRRDYAIPFWFTPGIEQGVVGD